MIKEKYNSINRFYHWPRRTMGLRIDQWWPGNGWGVHPKLCLENGFSVTPWTFKGCGIQSAICLPTAVFEVITILDPLCTGLPNKHWRKRWRGTQP